MFLYPLLGSTPTLLLSCLRAIDGAQQDLGFTDQTASVWTGWHDGHPSNLLLPQLDLCTTTDAPNTVQPSHCVTALRADELWWHCVSHGSWLVKVGERRLSVATRCPFLFALLFWVRRAAAAGDRWAAAVPVASTRDEELGGV